MNKKMFLSLTAKSLGAAVLVLALLGLFRSKVSWNLVSLIRSIGLKQRLYRDHTVTQSVETETKA